jgi:hypothetical protein
MRRQLLVFASMAVLATGCAGTSYVGYRGEVRSGGYLRGQLLQLRRRR